MTKSGRRKRKKVSSSSSFEGNTTVQQEEDEESDTETSATRAANDNASETPSLTWNRNMEGSNANQNKYGKAGLRRGIP